MRVDTATGKGTSTTIFDVENQKMYVFDSKDKEADVWDMGAFAQELSSAVAVGDIQASITPNGQTKTIAGQSTGGYNLAITVPATIGGAGGMQVTVVQNGTTWVAKGVPGSAEYASFYQGAAEKGWIFSDPRAAKGSPGQAKAMARMYGELAKLGGLPYETQMDIKVQGEGPMAMLMARMGGVSTSSTVQSVLTNPIADDLFMPPPDYKLKTKE
jgi:hypothetical protein